MLAAPHLSKSVGITLAIGHMVLLVLLRLAGAPI
jgi:hypothetical protein